MSETRKLAAILVSDVVGYSRLAGADEDRTLARLRGLWSDLFDPAVSAHHGRIVKRTGDGALVEFRSVVDAVRCAIEVQNGMVDRNAGVPAERRIEFRIGVHLGDVVEERDGDLMGDGVNIAARLEGVCEPGCIYLSEDAFHQVNPYHFFCIFLLLHHWRSMAPERAPLRNAWNARDRIARHFCGRVTARTFGQARRKPAAPRAPWRRALLWRANSSRGSSFAARAGCASRWPTETRAGW